MNPDTNFKISNPIPICAGTGLIALDIVINGDPWETPRRWAGGSCGNVLTILSFLGWRSFPIARLGSDAAAKEIYSDLHKFNIELDFVEFNETSNTPIIIEKISEGKDGLPVHRFHMICPYCGNWLPRYQAILLNKARSIARKLPDTRVFYFDRVSPGALELAISARNKKALIVFEPSSFKNDNLFKKAMELSHMRLSRS